MQLSTNSTLPEPVEWTDPQGREWVFEADPPFEWTKRALAGMTGDQWGDWFRSVLTPESRKAYDRALRSAPVIDSGDGEEPVRPTALWGVSTLQTVGRALVAHWNPHLQFVDPDTDTEGDGDGLGK